MSSTSPERYFARRIYVEVAGGDLEEAKAVLGSMENELEIIHESETET